MGLLRLLVHKASSVVLGFRGSGVWEFRGLGFRVQGFRGLGFRVLVFLVV